MILFVENLKLIIEIDGYSHNFKYGEDKLRDEKLLKNGYSVLRVSEHEVKYDLDNIVRTIENKIYELEQSIPQPPLKRGNKPKIELKELLEIPLWKRGSGGFL